VPDFLTADVLRERLNMDLPGVLAPRPPEPSPEPEPETKSKGKGKGAHAKPNLLATDNVVVLAPRIIDVAVYIRDTLGYSFLSDMVAVDYLEDGLMELVYLFYHPEGGPELNVRVRMPRDAPDVPSLTSIWPGANFMEREAYDLFGINFIGHPYLKRIYMWDELEGYPMRKDFPKQGDKYLDEE
jgi:NADH-quinone oxidoreductase subunit C